MTIEEKRKAIQTYCITRDEFNVPCSGCPLTAVAEIKSADEPCFTLGANIERNYEILFGGHAAEDNVNHPAHYETGKFECIDVMVETQGVRNVQAFCICNAFKYLYRHRNKNHLEDVKKAVWYLNKFIELEEGACK